MADQNVEERCIGLNGGLEGRPSGNKVEESKGSVGVEIGVIREDGGD